jgi:hypothetical protein
MGDRLTDGPTKHWTGVRDELNGLVRVDEKTYRFLGDADRGIPAQEGTNRQITPTRTVVTLQNAEIEFRVTFLTPAFPDDLRIMARPITYLVWDVKSRDGAKHDVGLYLDADAAIATNSRDESVAWSRAEVKGLHLLRTGTTRQPMLVKSGDNLRIDWGYFYLAVRAAEGASTLLGRSSASTWMAPSAM